MYVNHNCTHCYPTHLPTSPSLLPNSHFSTPHLKHKFAYERKYSESSNFMSSHPTHFNITFSFFIAKQGAIKYHICLYPFFCQWVPGMCPEPGYSHKATGRTGVCPSPSYDDFDLRTHFWYKPKCNITGPYGGSRFSFWGSSILISLVAV